jgi:hypothetical protein
MDFEGQLGDIPMFIKRMFAFVLSVSLVIATPFVAVAQQPDQEQTSQPQELSATPLVKQTPEQLQQLVAPIALYPDELVAEVLAAATYPTEVVEADRWLQEHKNLQGKELGDEVDKQPWDSSVKALTEFPSVLANMDKNLSWASSLGDAYVNQQKDVMDAVQVMRQRAEQAGNLQSNSQEKVTQKDKTIVIEEASPDVVYVPTYDPWISYGAPIGIWPGWYWYPGLYATGPGIFFGAGFGLGFFGGYGWGWHHWGFDWGHRNIIYNHNTYISHSHTFVNRGSYYRGSRDFGGRGGHDFGGHGVNHGFESRGAQPGVHSGAFSGFNHGGVARSQSFGGHSSFGGGGFHGGGGGGFHGGGGGHGGGHR